MRLIDILDGVSQLGEVTNAMSRGTCTRYFPPIIDDSSSCQFGGETSLGEEMIQDVNDHEGWRDTLCEDECTVADKDMVNIRKLIRCPIVLGSWNPCSFLTSILLSRLCCTHRLNLSRDI
jgi:hypothetical protein